MVDWIFLQFNINVKKKLYIFKKRTQSLFISTSCSMVTDLVTHFAVDSFEPTSRQGSTNIVQKKWFFHRLKLKNNNLGLNIYELRILASYSRYLSFRIMYDLLFTRTKIRESKTESELSSHWSLYISMVKDLSRGKVRKDELETN